MINNYDISCIIESIKKRGGLFQGSIITATNINALNYYNITSVLSIYSEFKIQNASEINNLIFDCHDTPHFDMTTLFEQAHNYLESSRQYTNFLVHCHEGISRSTTIVVSYMMKKRNLNIEQAFIYVIYQRPIVSLYQGFIKQLFLTEQNIYGRITSLLNESITPYFHYNNKSNQYHLLILLKNQEHPYKSQKIILIQKSNPLILPLDLSLLVSQSSCNLHLNKHNKSITNIHNLLLLKYRKIQMERLLLTNNLFSFHLLFQYPKKLFQHLKPIVSNKRQNDNIFIFKLIIKILKLLFDLQNYQIR
ncbi:unnamed protein product [Paramecium primaurelia]|uniref:protein-tyrosine-phosphatase n=1 Tax=Paramecium primaurelia TaxID=5886 RepID=A0A8S1PVS0_PARPR|nr:unnamed protein product [Paramecium primaurelia]CAD8107138.1 unnamed protein product [Paramecium primaurelia]CAD8107144.1 unnamed protein product [Paramecium primaurelia]